MPTAIAKSEEKKSKSEASPERVPESSQPNLVGAIAGVPLFLQTDLMVGPPGDEYEQEADRVANASAQHAPVAGSSNAPQLAGNLAVQRQIASMGSGDALGPSVRELFESRFGQDLHQVRVHTGSAAADSAKLVHARAFTSGRNVVFGSGQFDPESEEGRKLIAHELTHVAQNANGAAPARELSMRADASEREASQVADSFVGGAPLPAITARNTARIARQDDPDHPASPPPPPRAPGVNMEPLAEWDPEIDSWDQATFWTPPNTSREQIALRLYDDRNHVGGFDIIGEKHVRMRNFDGVVENVTTPMREALNKRLTKDVDAVIAILKQRLINDADEWSMFHTTVWWASRGDLTNAEDRSYFDRYLDELDTHRLTEGGVFSNTTKPGSEWLFIELEEKQWAVYPLVAGRSIRGTPRSAQTGNEMPEFNREVGPITNSSKEPYYRNAVGTYEYLSGENRTGIEKEKHNTEQIRVGELIVTETSATRAEIALRNASPAVARVMIPGGNGKYYGYTIASPGFWNEGQPIDPRGQRLQNYWWHYPGTVFIPGGSFQPEFGKGSEAERDQRKEILKRALEGGLEQLQGLDFDVLSLLTMDQRISVLGMAIGSQKSANVSLVVRLLHSTPATEFAVLEHRLSTNGMMVRLLSMSSPEGGQAIIGRIFTMKALESMQVPGETLENLPEFKVGFDEEGFYHWGNITGAGTAPSQLLSSAQFPQGGAVGIAQERAAPGETPGQINRAVTSIQPQIFRLGGEGLVGMGENFVRAYAKTLIVPDGPPKGPYMPTQLVRVTTMGPNPQTRVATVLEAIGLLQLPDASIMQRMISTHIHGFMVLMAASGIARAFGPALAGAILEGGGARAVGTALLETAATGVARTAIVDAALIAGMEAVDQNREAISKTAEGRAFLEIYDVAMMVWIANDVARLIASGLVPRLIAAADRVIALPGVLRDSIMPLRAEAEAMRRTIARYATPAEALAAATNEGITAATGGAERTSPGFFTLLRVSRGEVAAERLAGRIAGTPAQAVGKRVLGRLEGAITRAETEAAAVTGNTAEAAEARAAATRRMESVANARFAIAERASQLRPEAREAFLNAVDGVIASRPNSISALTDLLTSAAESRTPNVFIAEVQRLVSRPGVSDEALLVLGAKVRGGSNVLDLAWLNRTSISDEALDFLGRDKRTPWDLYRRAAADPTAEGVMRSFRTSARGAGAEMVAEKEAERISTNVRRQVPMGGSEIDFEIVVAGRKHGFEVKGWTPETWDEALEPAIQRLNKKGLTDSQRQAVGKIDTMITQLQDAQMATGRRPYLGITDGLSEHSKGQLRRVLRANGLGSTELVPLSEASIKEAAAGTIGAPLGVPRP